VRSKDRRSTHLLCINLGNRAFPAHAYTIYSWPDTHSSYPNFAIQTILPRYTLVRCLYRFRWSLADAHCSSTRYPAWLLVRDKCCCYQGVLFFSRHDSHWIHRAPSDGFNYSSQGANLADTGLAFVHFLTRCCHVSRLSCKDRWCGSGCFQATFLGRVFTSSTMELDNRTLGKDSVGMLSYSSLSLP
jgi:hypothetical protein